MARDDPFHSLNDDPFEVADNPFSDLRQPLEPPAPETRSVNSSIAMIHVAPTVEGEVREPNGDLEHRGFAPVGAEGDEKVYGYTYEEESMVPLSNLKNFTAIADKDKMKRFWSPEQLKAWSLKTVKGTFPVIDWLANYKWKADILSDVIAGLTVTIVMVPQSMAYTLLAELPPVYGLYTAVMPIALYFFLGTSRHISVGPYALVALMIAQALKAVYYKGVSIDSNDPEYIGRVMTLTLITGIVQMILWIFRFGYLMVLLSDSMMSGFTTAAAFHIAVSQLGHLLGTEHTGTSHSFADIFYKVYNAFADYKEIKIGAIIFTVASAFILILAKFLNHKLHHRLRIPIPGELIAVVLCTLVSWGARPDLNDADKEDLLYWDVVQDIPAGPPPVAVPKLTGAIFMELLQQSVIIAIISYVMCLGIVKTYCLKFQYPVDLNQELFSLGVSNIFSSFFSSYVSCGSLSRSAVLVSAGGRSQIASAIGVVGILLTLQFLTGLFYFLPIAVLGSVIVVALAGIFGQFSEAKRLWKVNKMDFSVWVVTFSAVILLGVQIGIAVGIGFSWILVIYRSVFPSSHVLGTTAERERGFTEINGPGYPGFSGGAATKDPSTVHHHKAEEIDGIKIFRFESSLIFTNVEYFKSSLYKYTVNPFSNAPTRVHTVVVSAGFFQDIDMAGVRCLVNVCKDYKSHKGVQVLIGGLTADAQKSLIEGGFIKEVGENRLFSTVAEAVAYAIENRPEEVIVSADRMEALGSHQEERQGLVSGAVAPQNETALEFIQSIPMSMKQTMLEMVP